MENENTQELILEPVEAEFVPFEGDGISNKIQTLIEEGLPVAEAIHFGYSKNSPKEETPETIKEETPTEEV
jgi:hypothetical protein